MSGILQVNEIIPDTELSIDGDISVEGVIKTTGIVNIEETVLQLMATVSDQQTAISKLQKESAPTGTIKAFGGDITNPDGTIDTNKIPQGWLLCDGESYLRTEKSELYSKIGTLWGAPNGDEFNVPDLRGVFLRGLDTRSELDEGKDPDAADRIDKNESIVGAVIGSYQNDEFFRHVHTTGNSNSSGTNYGVFMYGERGGADNETGNEVRETGGNETRPKNAAVHYIIKE